VTAARPPSNWAARAKASHVDSSHLIAEDGVVEGGGCCRPDFHLEDQGKGVVLVNNEQLTIETGQSATTKWIKEKTEQQASGSSWSSSSIR
jgi:hypothetical protein